MLPKGKLAKHGYDVQHGFFNGTCWGAGYQPFEVAYDAIEKAIGWATEQRDKLLLAITAVEAETVDLPFRRYVSGFYRDGVYIKAGYQWQTVRLSQAEGQPVTIEFADGKSEPAFRYSLGYGLEEIAARLRSIRIGAYQMEVKSRTEYVVWQTGRIKNWKEQPLKEVK